VAAVDNSGVGAVIGRRIREIRERAGRSQDEVASAARRAGLDWTRAAVASLETGRRGLSAEELLLLPLTLRLLDEEDHTLAELLEGAPKVIRLSSGREVGGPFLRRLLEGEATATNVSGREMARGLHSADPEGIAYMAAREAERHAAKQLEVTAEAVVGAAMNRWRRGLTEERERRVDEERAGRPLPLRSLQSIRGHVTRTLIEELRQSMGEES
jgi:transcriptional regulator with XRE-family HTH domain